MCFLGICKSRKITDEEFENAFEKNDDGFGMAWFEENKIHVKKGLMTVDDALAFYKSREFPFPHIVHFRLGSPTDELLTHPFMIAVRDMKILEYSTTKDVVFHNGVVTGWQDKYIAWCIANKKQMPWGVMSDTRAIAAMCTTLGHGFLEYVSGKWAIMVGATGRIKAVGKFDDDHGMMCSNDSYKTPKWKGQTKGGAAASSWHGRGNFQWSEVIHDETGAWEIQHFSDGSTSKTRLSASSVKGGKESSDKEDTQGRELKQLTTSLSSTTKDSSGQTAAGDIEMTHQQSDDGCWVPYDDLVVMKDLRDMRTDAANYENGTHAWADTFHLVLDFLDGADYLRV